MYPANYISYFIMDYGFMLFFLVCVIIDETSYSYESIIEDLAGATTPELFIILDKTSLVKRKHKKEKRQFRNNAIHLSVVN